MTSLSEVAADWLSVELAARIAGYSLHFHSQALVALYRPEGGDTWSIWQGWATDTNKAMVAANILSRANSGASPDEMLSL